MQSIDSKDNLSNADFAIINIYRPKAFMGSCCPVDVLINGLNVAKLYNGGHLKYKVHDLSTLEITIKSKSLASYRLRPEANGEYYLETNPQFSGFTLEQISNPVEKKNLKDKNYKELSDLGY